MFSFDKPTNCINGVFKTNKFFNVLNLSKVESAHKKLDITDETNCRLDSMVTLISKIFVNFTYFQINEKHMQHDLLEHFKMTSDLIGTTLMDYRRSTAIFSNNLLKIFPFVILQLTIVYAIVAKTYQTSRKTLLMKQKLFFSGLQ